jgi:hypothetical protein
MKSRKIKRTRQQERTEKIGNKYNISVEYKL